MASRNKCLPPGGGGQPPQLPPLGHTPQIPPRGTMGGGATAALLSAGGGNHHKNSNAPLQPQMSERYIEALKVLNEDTMSKACALLLSERDYETKTDPTNDSDDANTKTDMEQLLAMYEQVQKAAKIVKQLAPVEIVKSSQAADVLGIPKLLSTSSRGGGGGGPQTSKKPGSSIANSSSTNISSLHSTLKRGTMGNPKTAHHHHSHSHHQAAHQRGRSMNNDMNKKPRIMSLSTAPPLSRSRSVSPPPLNASAPPPSAQNFLAKLNKDPSSSATVTKEGGNKNSNKGQPVAGQKRGRSDSTASAASIQSNGHQRGRSDSTVSAASVASNTSRSSRTSNKPAASAAPAPASNRGGRPQRASSQRASQAIKESASSPPALYIVTGDGGDDTRGVEGEDVEGGGDDSGTNINKRTTKSPPTRMQPSRAASRKG